jgi:dTDP-4-dehydrorhamnose 3,5-epimerase
MKFTPTPLAGAWVIDIERHADDRGFFARTFCTDEFSTRGITFTAVQCNISHNARQGTLRGMHFQKPPYEEPKLVSCAAGAVYDVVIDIRPTSPTYAQWFGVELSAANHAMVFIPGGFAHGFIALTDNADVAYMMGARYSESAASGIRFDDPAIGIVWPIVPTIISDRDRAYSRFERPA